MAFHPGDLPDPGIKLGSLALQVDSLPCSPPGKLLSAHISFFFCHFSVTHYFCQLASIAEGVEIKNRHHFTSALSLSQPLSAHAHGKAGWRDVRRREAA